MPAPAVRSISVRSVDILSAVPTETAVGAIRSAPLVLAAAVGQHRVGLLGHGQPFALDRPGVQVNEQR